MSIAKFFACFFLKVMEILNLAARYAEEENRMLMRPEHYQSCNNASEKLGDIVATFMWRI
ncbi:MAG TPA: hypothetical protein VHS31_07115 [Tepidisphaeraceae bacterium]|jgi:hypothetical protein|nr:hypothetical protein [Tepidisphaeraceae bacterium]